MVEDKGQKDLGDDSGMGERSRQQHISENIAFGIVLTFRTLLIYHILKGIKDEGTPKFEYKHSKCT